MMIKIAITGNIGTGKSTIANIVKRMGLKVFESDLITNEIYKDKKVLNKLKKEFDNKIVGLFDSRKLINKEKLGNYVFANKKELQTLESIIHPRIKIKKKKFESQYHNEKVLFYDIPLLFEKDMQTSFDFIFYTYVDLRTQRSRVLKRKKMNEKKFINILKSQNNINPSQKKFVSLNINTKEKIEDIQVTIENFLSKNVC